MVCIFLMVFSYSGVQMVWGYLATFLPFFVGWLGFSVFLFGFHFSINQQIRPRFNAEIPTM